MRPILVSGNQLIAARFSDVTKIKTAEQELESKAKQLSWINQELTNVNQEMSRRELRMVELMREVEELKKKP